MQEDDKNLLSLSQAEREEEESESEFLQEGGNRRRVGWVVRMRWYHYAGNVDM
jgi:hypothetical protein